MPRLATLSMLMFVLAACGGMVTGSGDVETEVREVDAFTRIELAGSAEVQVTLGEPRSLEVEAEDNILPLLESVVAGDTLELGQVSGTGYRATEPVIFRVTAPSLAGIEVSGSGRVVVQPIAEREFEVEISGSGTVEAVGVAGEVEVEISGSGTFRGEELQAEEVDARVSGSGRAIVWATERLDADVSGSGDILYVEDPDDLETRVSGSGSIDRYRR